MFFADSLEPRRLHVSTAAEGVTSAGAHGAGRGESDSAVLRQPNGVGGDPVAYRQERYDELLAIVEAQKINGEDQDTAEFGIGMAAAWTREQENKIAIVEHEPHRISDSETVNVVVEPEEVGEPFVSGEAHATSVTLQYRTQCRPGTDDIQYVRPAATTAIAVGSEEPAIASSAGVALKASAPTSDESTATGKVMAGLEVKPPTEVVPGLVREVRHKRHVIEEIVIEDCEKFYEDQSSSLLRKKKRMRTSTTPDVGVVEAAIEAAAPTAQLSAELPQPMLTSAGSDNDVDSRSPNRHSITYVVHYDLPAAGKPHQMAPPTAAAEVSTVAGSPPMAVDDELSVTYVVHHDLLQRLSSRGRTAESSPAEAILPSDASLRVCAAPSDRSPELEGDSSVTYVTRYEIAPSRRSKTTRSAAAAAAMADDDPKDAKRHQAAALRGGELPSGYLRRDVDERIEVQRMAGPAYAFPATVAAASGTEHVTYVVEYEIKTKQRDKSAATPRNADVRGEAVGEGPGDMGPARQSAVESTRFNLEQQRIEARQDESQSNVASPATAASSVTYVVEYEIVSKRRGKRKTDARAAEGLQSAAGEFDVRRRTGELQTVGQLRTYPDTGPESAAYVIDYAVEPRRRDRSRTPQVVVESEQAGQIARTPDVRAATLETEQEVVVPYASSQLHSAPVPDAQSITYVVDYEVTVRPRGKKKTHRDSAAVAAADVGQHQAAAFDLTPAEAALSVGPQVLHETASREPVTYVVEYEIQSKGGKKLKTPQISVTSDVHDGRNVGPGLGFEVEVGSPAVENVERSAVSSSQFGAPGLAPDVVTYVVEYEITAKKNKNQAIINVSTGHVELPPVEQNDGTQVEGRVEVPESATYVVEYEIVTKKRGKAKTARMPVTSETERGRPEQETTKRTDETSAERTMDVHGSVEVPVFVSQMQSPPTVAVPDSMTYTVDYEIQSKKRAPKAAALFEVEGEMREPQPMEPANEEFAARRFDVELPQVFSQTYSAPVAGPESVTYMIEYEIRPKKLGKTRTPHNAGAFETGTGASDVETEAKIDERPGQLSIIGRQETGSPQEQSVLSPVDSTTTYVIEYEIQRKMRSKAKHQLEGEATIAVERGSLPLQSVQHVGHLSSEVETGTEQVVSSPPVATEATPNTITYVVEYDIVTKKRGKMTHPQSSASAAAGAETSGEAAVKVELFQVTAATSSAVFDAQASPVEASAARQDAESITYAVEYEIRTKRKDKSKVRLAVEGSTAAAIDVQQAAVSGEVCDVITSKDVYDEFRWERREEPVRVAATAESATAAEASFGPEEIIRYVVEYEIGAKRRSRFESTARTIAASASTSTDAAASASSKTYEVKVTEPAEVTKMEIGVDVEDGAEPAAEYAETPQAQVAADDVHESMTFVVEYEILKKERRGKVAVPRPVADADAAACVEAPEVVTREMAAPPATEVRVDAERDGDGSASLEVSLPTTIEPTTSEGQETVTYVVSYEISAKNRRKKITPPKIGIAAGETEIVSASTQPEVETSLTGVAAQTRANVELSAEGEKMVETVTYVTDYEIAVREKRKVKKSPAPVSTAAVGADIGSADVEFGTASAAVSTSAALETLESAAARSPAASLELKGEAPDSSVETITYVVDYDVQVRRKTRQKRQQPQPQTQQPRAEAGAANANDSDVTAAGEESRVVSARVDQPSAIAAVDPEKEISLPISDSITYVVEYEILKKHLRDGANKKAKSAKSVAGSVGTGIEGHVKTEVDTSLNVDAPKEFIGVDFTAAPATIAVAAAGQPEVAIVLPNEAATGATESITYVIEHDTSAADATSIESPKLAIDMEFSGEDKTDLRVAVDIDAPKVEVKVEDSEVTRDTGIPVQSAADGNGPQSVTYVIEYEIQKLAGKKARKSRDAEIALKVAGSSPIAPVSGQLAGDSPAQPESLYLYILSVAAASTDDGDRGRRSTKQQPVKVTYITSHPLPTRKSGKKKPSANVAAEGESRQQQQQQHFGAEFDLPTIKEEISGEISVERQRSTEHDDVLSEPAIGDLTHQGVVRPDLASGDATLSSDAVIVETGVRTNADEIVPVSFSDGAEQATYEVHYDAPKLESSDKKVISVKVRGEKKAKTPKQQAEEETETETVTYIVDYDLKDLIAKNRSKTFLVTGTRLGKKYEVGKKEKASAAASAAAVDVTMQLEPQRDEEDEIFDANMRMVIESTARGTEHLHPSEAVAPDEKTALLVAEFDRLLPDDHTTVKATTVFGVYQEPAVGEEPVNVVVAEVDQDKLTQQQAPSTQLLLKDDEDSSQDKMLPMVAAVAFAAQNGNESVKFVVDYEIAPKSPSEQKPVYEDAATERHLDEPAEVDEPTAPSSQLQVRSSPTKAATPPADDKPQSGLSTPTSGFSETVTYIVDYDWSTISSSNSPTARGRARPDLEISPTSTLRADSPEMSTPRPVAKAKKSTLKMPPPINVLDCQDSGIDQETSSPTFSGASVGAVENGDQRTERVTYIVSHERSVTPTKFRWNLFDRHRATEAHSGSSPEPETFVEKSVALRTSASLPDKGHSRHVLLLRPLDNADTETGKRRLDKTSSAASAAADVGRIPLPLCDRHFVVVAIDFGTTFSGYAFSFTSVGGGPLKRSDVQAIDTIHVMRRWEGGDPGVVNHKAPTTLLIDPTGEFHSFGFTARDFYHDLSPRQAKRWTYFEKFKMALHNDAVSLDVWRSGSRIHRAV
jgi:hypothetical protein